MASTPAFRFSLMGVGRPWHLNVYFHISHPDGTVHSACFPFLYQGLDRYVKKKQLDPLDTYVPLVLEARGVLAGLDGVMGMCRLNCSCWWLPAVYLHSR
jgi:hypothetical protein